MNLVALEFRIAVPCICCGSALLIVAPTLIYQTAVFFVGRRGSLGFCVVCAPRPPRVGAGVAALSGRPGLPAPAIELNIDGLVAAGPRRQDRRRVVARCNDMSWALVPTEPAPPSMHCTTARPSLCCAARRLG